jgi:Flp pilus assembly protein TadB
MPQAIDRAAPGKGGGNRVTTVLLIACIGMIAGFFLILGISPMSFTGAIFFGRLIDKPKSIRDEVKRQLTGKKRSYLRRQIAEAQSILKVTGRENRFPMLCALSLALFAAGASAAIILSNFFLVPVMAVGMMFLPFWYVKLTQTHFKKNIAAELETALSIITTAYLRNEDILTAVEENLAYLNPPVLSVFRDFVNRVRLVDPDVEAAHERPPGADRQSGLSGMVRCLMRLSVRPQPENHTDPHCE